MTTTVFAAVDTSASTAPNTVQAAEPTEFTSSGSGDSYNAKAPQSPTSSRGFAITSFVLGIASVVAGWTFVAPIIGFVLGLMALRRGTTERSLALWGTWINGIILALATLGFLLGAALVSAGVLALPFVLA